MDDVLQKLLVLDYVRGFAQAKDIAPFSRAHFATPGPNAGCVT